MDVVPAALLSVFIDNLFWETFHVERFLENMEDDPSVLKKLRMALIPLHYVLNDAEEKQNTDLVVQEWLHDLKDVVYDADNLLDKVKTRVLVLKIEAESQALGDQVRAGTGARKDKHRRQPLPLQKTKPPTIWEVFSNPSSWVLDKSPTIQNVFHSLSSWVRGRFNSELKELVQKLEHFAKQQYTLGLKVIYVSWSNWQSTATTSVVSQSTIYGRDGEMNKLKKYLLSNDDCYDHVGVITIVGRGGVGKTTLAEILYSDQEVQGYFDLKAWAYITKEFDAFRVTKTLLESVSGKPVVTNNLNDLQVELQQRLSGKKFLFVLDDLWDKCNDWDRLKTILKCGGVGSRVIVTTQENVALGMNTFPVHYLSPLSDEQCWELLAEHAFGSKQPRINQKLKMIGRKVADKCCGLPLAVKALGSLLRIKLSEKDWYEVLKSDIWDLPDEVLPPLRLSYHYLPAHLKACFAHCSIFPKNYELDKETVVRLWMAEGLIPDNSYRSLEETGNMFFDELVSRSLILKDSHYENVFKMHDLINDLATAIMAGHCLRYEDSKLGPCLNKVRHLSYNRGKYDHQGKFESILETKDLRTFIALPLKRDQYQIDRNCYLAKRVLHDLFLKMRYLRALSLSHYDNICELPDSLRNLIHLRYLDLSFTRIKRLPNEACKLYNLQTLLLSNCEYLIELPQDIDKLVNLRHIDLSGTKLKEMPTSVSRLKNLKTLTSFVVSENKDGLKVNELGNFLHLHGKLSILNLQNVVDANDAFQANLKNKEPIDELAFKWGPDTEDSLLERQVLDYLQPTTNLKKLTIEFYGGTSFSNWLGDSSFCNMVSLCLSDCNKCVLLPPLGQLLTLKSLKIYRLKSLEVVGTEFYGGGSSSFQPFPSLEVLIFDEMPKWKHWLSIRDKTVEFPSLQDLHVFRCPRLRGSLPNNLPSLITLRVFGCNVLELQSSNEVDKIGNVGENEIPPKWSSNFKWTNCLQTLQVAQSPGVLSSLETRVMPFLNYFTVAGYHESLQLFPKMINSSNCLQTLYIHSIPTLKSFQKDGLPTSLGHLGIFNCEKLEFLPLKLLHKYTSLMQLVLSDSCHSMESFPLDSFPVLMHLEIKHCTNLKSFSVSDNLANNLSHLKTLYVRNCPNLISFPPGGLCAFNLERLLVHKCEKLISLPERINTLITLQYLLVCELPCLQSFAEEGLPSNLQKLEVFNCEKLSTTSITEWGSQRLTSLTEITIGGDDLVDSLMKKLLLPTSLVSLCIRDISSFDGKGLQHLTSLDNLQFKSCWNLELLPEKELLNLSLSVLSISDCPLLQETYQSNGGTNWPNIAHIPCIEINEEVMM